MGIGKVPRNNGILILLAKEKIAKIANQYRLRRLKASLTDA